MSNQYVLGADIGGTHITTTIVDLERRSILEQTYIRAKVDSAASADEIINQWSAAIIGAFKKANIQPGKIGIAMPGPFDYKNGISLIKDNKKYESLYRLNVKQLLAKEIGINSSDILMANDAQCFLSGEMFSGSVKNYKKVIGITLGTGLGSAISNNGDVSDADLWCSPFKDSIAEEYLSTRWFLKRYFELTGLNALNVKDLSQQFADSATVQDLFKEFASNLAQFIIGFADKINPDAIVLGGNISKASDLFMSALLRDLKHEHLNIPVFISLLNENAAIVGAASAWHNH